MPEIELLFYLDRERVWVCEREINGEIKIEKERKIKRIIPLGRVCMK